MASPTESLPGIATWITLESIGRAPAQPLRVGLSSSLRFPSFSCPAHFYLLRGHPCSDQNSFGALFWEWPRLYCYSRAESTWGTARCGAECRKRLEYREHISPIRFSLPAYPRGVGRRSGADLPSPAISWFTRFSGTRAFGLRVLFANDSIRMTGRSPWGRRALGEWRKRLRFRQRRVGGPFTTRLKR